MKRPKDFMKRAILVITYTVCFVGFYNNSFSQKSITNSKSYPCNRNLAVKSPNDTLEPSSFATGTPTLYKFIDGGYDFGTNTLGDLADAQVYKVTKSYIIDGVAIWAGAKVQVGSADTLLIKMYRLNGEGTDTSGAANDAPNDTIGDLLENIILSDSLVSTTGLTIISFTNPLIVDSDYAVGVDFSMIKDDTIGLVTTTDSDAHKTQLAWNQAADYTWETILYSQNWNMDVDLGIFVIVDTSNANIRDNYFIDGLKLSQNQPNPASCSTLIQYELQDDACNVSLEIYDANGKRMLTYNEGKQSAGKYTIPVNVENIGSGIYYYSLKAGSHLLTKKMSVVK